MDIEDIVKNNINNKNKIKFVEELSNFNYNSRQEYDKKYTELRKKYKIIIKKTEIRKLIENIKDKNKITSSFLEYSIKKRGKSCSGVSVITILTDPFPEYVKEGKLIKQSFSCGKNCSYCPNEPEMRLNLTVIDKLDSNKYLLESDINLKLIRVINHIIFNKKEYNVKDTYNFKDNTFTCVVNIDLNINDKLIGVKIAQPRSYISSEPAVLRANRNNFNVKDQIHDRCDSLTSMGHPVDKLEILILGGTWDHYPIDYREQFIRNIYHSVNIYNGPYHTPFDLKSEIKLNETAPFRIIGITTETRPDCITVREIKNLRKMNITRVQLGVQHLDNDVLKFINRGCYLKDTINSNYILKQNGYKIDNHYMPDLPGSSFIKDLHMFKKLFSHAKIQKSKNYIKYILEYPELQADQLKIYPCSTVPFTEIKEWYDSGRYKPYSEDREKLIDLIMYIKTNIFPWIRLNRIIRDIPSNWIDGGNKDVSLRQHVLKEMDKLQLECKCIRCREVGNKSFNIHEAELITREYNGYNGTEYFISYESKDQKICIGFIRLRINHTNEKLFHKDLYDCAFIRELHVYGKLSKHYEKGKNIQHKGIGKKLSTLR